MSTNRISAEHTAKALLINLALYCGEKGKDLSRFRISRASIKLSANRLTLRESFLYDVIDEMAQLGWSCIAPGTMANDSDLAFIQTDKIDVWPKLGSGRVRSLVRRSIRLSEVQDFIDEEYDRHYPEQEGHWASDD